MRARKKPVVIDAVQFIPENQHALAAHLANCDGWFRNDQGIIIPTLEGSHLASPGDWIIRGVKGEFYPCKPDIFDATYDLVDDAG